MADGRKACPSDLSDTQWKILSSLIPPERPGVRHRKYDIREILNAILYVLKSGCAWRLLPHDFPNWQAVYHYFRQWRKDGTWVRIHDRLREELRKKQKV